MKEREVIIELLKECEFVAEMQWIVVIITILHTILDICALVGSCLSVMKQLEGTEVRKRRGRRRRRRNGKGWLRCCSSLPATGYKATGFPTEHCHWVDTG